MDKLNDYEKVHSKYHPMDVEGDRLHKPIREKYLTKEECEVAGHIWRRGYTTKRGVHVKGYCVPYTSEEEMRELNFISQVNTRNMVEENIKKHEEDNDKCGPGREYVKGYYNEKGEWVRGYCRKKHDRRFENE